MLVADPDWMGTDGPPLFSEPKAVRPCLRERLSIRDARWDFIARYAGRRTPAWIGRCLGLTSCQVIRFMWRYGVGPTQRDDLLLSSDVADILGCTQQWVVRLIKAKKLRGWRNPGGQWWLVPREAVTSYLKQDGQNSDDIRLNEPSGWPGIKLSTHGHRGGKRQCY